MPNTEQQGHDDVAISNVLIGLDAATDLIEDLKNQVNKLRERTREAIAETIQCSESCDNSCDSLAEAVQAGWLDITFDPDGRSWNYLGFCPACRAEEHEEERHESRPKGAGTLFDLSPERP